MVMNPTVTKMDNWMTILKQMNDGGTRSRGPKNPHLKWTNTLNCKELQKYENLSGHQHSLPVGSSEKDFFELFVTNYFNNKVAEEKINLQLYQKEKREQWITIWKKSKPILEFRFIWAFLTYQRLRIIFKAISVSALY